MRRARGLTPDEAALWRALAASVTPLHPSRAAPGEANPRLAAPGMERHGRPGAALDPGATAPLRLGQAAPGPAPRAGLGADARAGLDAGWERRLARGLVEPDLALDLHGATLDAAHARLDAGLARARALGARVVLVVAGRPRPVEAADRARARGAIRAKLVDWLAAGAHAAAIAAVRPAHRRHGGAGALYLVLRRRG